MHWATRYLSISMFVLFSNTMLGQQTIEIDWATRQPTSPPITVDGQTAVTIVVDRVNDFLYDYSGALVVTGMVAPQLPALLQGSCAALEGKLAQLKIVSLYPLDTAAAKPQAPHSISLEEFTAAYLAGKSVIESITDADVATCTGDQPAKDEGAFLHTNASRWDALQRQSVASPPGHSFRFSGVLQALQSYQIVISERFQGIATDLKCDSAQVKGGSCAIVYQPTNNILTSSQGFLLSTIPSYTYTRATVPGSTGAQLSVVNSTPIGVGAVALINVKLPLWSWFERNLPNYSADISLGPAYQLNSNNQAGTRLGFFAGLSVTLWKYFVVTPGVQIAQYAAYPAGFTHNGQDIPTTFTGSLTPTNKNTVKMGLALTFKDWKMVTTNKPTQGTPTAPIGTTK